MENVINLHLSSLKKTFILSYKLDKIDAIFDTK